MSNALADQEITNRPVSATWDQTLAQDAYPKAAWEAITAYKTAHDAWQSEYTALTLAIAAVSQATIADRAALSAAVAAGKGDPGAVAVEKAERAVVFATEKTVQAREKATASAGALRQSLKDAALDLIAPVLANVKSAWEDYQSALDDAESNLRSSAARLADSYSGGSKLIGPCLLANYNTAAFSADGGTVEAPRLSRDSAQRYAHRISEVEKALAASASPSAKSKPRSEDVFH